MYHFIKFKFNPILIDDKEFKNITNVYNISISTFDENKL